MRINIINICAKKKKRGLRSGPDQLEYIRTEEEDDKL